MLSLRFEIQFSSLDWLSTIHCYRTRVSPAIYRVAVGEEIVSCFSQGRLCESERKRLGLKSEPWLTISTSCAYNHYTTRIYTHTLSESECRLERLHYTNRTNGESCLFWKLTFYKLWLLTASQANILGYWLLLIRRRKSLSMTGWGLFTAWSLKKTCLK